MSTRNGILVLAMGLGQFAVGQNPVVQAVIDAVRIDSMVHYVNELSGEVPTQIAGSTQTILSRHKDNAGNALAQTYLEQKFTQFGYTPVVQTFGPTGRNILATKIGTLYPNDVVILCAHYDAMPGGMLDAPAADDDGSGVCAVLEAARILYDVPFEYTVVFALWDEEEQGLVGSEFYAGVMAANDGVIRGAINLDAIAYDGNGDTKARVHVRPIANSLELGDSVFSVLDNYGIDIDLLLTNPGATYSDHAAFWNEGYGAVLIIEEFNADGNPHYHTPTDRVEFFDVPYYEKLARLGIATAATIAVPVNEPQAVGAINVQRGPALYAYPNPTSEDAGLWLETTASGPYRVIVLDALGQEVALLHDGLLAMGKHAFRVPLSGLHAGGYVVLATTDGQPPMALRLVRTP